ncbi:MAG: hypothetical protein AVDCRST_MAG01-01-2691, partial [uncultured Rubrobacteraceae bacterium]
RGGDSARRPGGAQDRDALRRRGPRGGARPLPAPDPRPSSRPPRRREGRQGPGHARDGEGAGPAGRRVHRGRRGRDRLRGPLPGRGLGQPGTPAGPRQPPHGRGLHLPQHESGGRRRLRELDGQDLRRGKGGGRGRPRSLDAPRLRPLPRPKANAL